MPKSIKTLVKDVYGVIEGRGGWNKVVNDYFMNQLSPVLLNRFNSSDKPKDCLRFSNMGTPCERLLWYKINKAKEAEELTPNVLLKFLYGDILEVLLLSLAKAAGHTVTGEQDEFEIQGIKGHRDAVIDGVTVDVKSASPFSFKKFKEGELKDNDPFGYISQLSSYVYAAEEGVDKTKGAFFVVDKVHGHICLDLHDLSKEIKSKEEEVRHKKDMVKGPIPERGFEAIPQSKTSPNTKLNVNCSYCGFKHLCWPEMRTFLYSTGPQFLIKVEQEPRVFEVEKK